MTKIQEKFLNELRELMGKYNVEFHDWGEDGVHITSPINVECYNENYISISIDDV